MNSYIESSFVIVIKGISLMCGRQGTACYMHVNLLLCGNDKLALHAVI